MLLVERDVREPYVQTNVAFVNRLCEDGNEKDISHILICKCLRDSLVSQPWSSHCVRKDVFAPTAYWGKRIFLIIHCHIHCHLFRNSTSQKKDDT